MQFNERAFDEILNSAGVDRLVKSVADDIAAKARATAPVDSGAYRAGIVVTRKHSAPRPVYLIVGRDWKTLIIESQTGNLVRALRARRRR
jgi:hypothetical protein